ncbi:MAG: universal stress protein, partial [Gammaproteobacteria bacterium]
PGAVVAELAARHQAYLVISGVARDETLGRLLLGSTVETLEKQLQAPLLVVKRRPHGDYRHLVVATDLTPDSKTAGDAALAWWPNAQVDLFHAFALPFEGLLQDRTAAIERARLHAVEECQRYAAASTGGRYATTYCEHGEPAALLSDLVEARDIDLVVVGTEGRKGLAGMVLGSVAQRVLDRVPADVLVVPHTGS